MSSDEELGREETGKIVDLNEKRKKKEGGSDKPAMKEVYRCIAEVMHGRFSLWPKFPRRFHIMGGITGGYILLEENNNREVTPVSDDRVIRAIMAYSYDELRAMPDLLLTYGQAKEALGSFLGYGDDLAKEPSLVAGISEPGLTYKRLPFDIQPSLAAKEGCPVFMEAVSRMTEGEAVCAFIGSLFDAEADLSQYLWLYGQGGEGKSSVAAVIADIFGGAAWHSQPPSVTDRFWSKNLIGKRLVIFPDCNDYTFVTKGWFKSLTGGDTQSIEPKGKDHIQVKLKTKFLFLSNREPAISSAPSDTRRAIICDMEAFNGPHDPNYQERLTSEIEAIINFCVAKYHEKAGTRRLIPTVTDRVKELAEENEAYFEGIIKRSFEFDQDAFLPRYAFQDILRHQGVKNSHDIKKIKLRIMAEHGLQLEKPRELKKIKGYFGMRPVKAFESFQ